MVLVLVGLLPVQTVAERKRNISVRDAMREVGEVASAHQYPPRFRLMKMGSLKVEQTYFHIFSTYLGERQVWRILVFSNSGRYMGFYETTEEPLDLDAGEILFSGGDITVPGGEGEDDTIGGGNAITFTEKGPPEVADLPDGTSRFVFSPKRIRQEDPEYRHLVVAEQLIDAMDQRKYWRIREFFSDRARVKLSEERTKEAFTNVRRKVGDVESLDIPWLQTPDTAIFPVAFRRELLGLKITLDRNDKIDGLWILPYADAFPDLGENKTALTLPYAGRWRVLWGGDTRETSNYFGDRSRQHSREFVIADRYGKTYLDEGDRNQDYFAFGRPALAPAEGEVIRVVQGIEDHKPGRPDPYAPFGNAVVIRHATNEVSVIGYLMQGSITVKEGERVTVRQPIGRCGNSGNSSQPSIYYHLQDSEVLQRGFGYRPVFSDVLIWQRGRASVNARHIAVRGEYVEQHSVPLKK
jgi:murein DD-endopeptidase MepM/ murein hydrolase activator NlpD